MTASFGTAQLYALRCHQHKLSRPLGPCPFALSKLVANLASPRAFVLSAGAFAGSGCRRRAEVRHAGNTHGTDEDAERARQLGVTQVVLDHTTKQGAASYPSR